MEKKNVKAPQSAKKKKSGFGAKLRRTVKKLSRGRSGQGTMTMAMIFIAVAIVVFINLIVGQLPSNILQFDVSQRSVYRISDVSKEYAENLTNDIEFILLADSGSVDARISQFVYSYASMSEHITVREADPVLQPSILTEWNCGNNSLVVNCPDTGKFTAIPFFATDDALIIQSWSNYYNSYTDVSFDGDGQITSALDYVTGDTYGTAYQVTDHGESKLSASVAARISKANIELVDDMLSLSKDGIPADCGMLIFYAPTTDLSSDDLAAVRKFMADGGNVILLMEYVDLPNFNALMEEYGLQLQEGFVYDTQRYYEQYYTSLGYYCVYPLLANNNPITGKLESSAMIQYPRGMVQVTPDRETVTVTPFMASSEAGVLSNSSGDSVGQYLFGAVSSETLTDEAGNETVSNLAVISATSLIYEGITQNNTNLSNMDIFTNTVSSCFSAENISIAPKSLELNVNTVANYGFWSITFMIVIPVLFLATGLILWIRRRRS